MLEQFDEALENLNIAIKYRTTLKSPPTLLGSLYNSRGNLFKHMKRLDDALADYQFCLTLYEPIQFKGGISATKANISDILMRKGNYQDALQFRLEAIEIMEETNSSRNLPESFWRLSQIYESLDQHPLALDAYKQFFNIYDSLLSVQKDRAMSELQTEYETARKENIIKLQEQELTKKNAIQYFSIGVVVLLGIILALTYNSYRAKRKANTLLTEAAKRDAEKAQEIEKAYKQLQSTQAQLLHSEKMASLGQLTAGIAHEIKNPLNFVNNFAEVTAEMVGELKALLNKQTAETSPNAAGTAEDLFADIAQNCQLIAHHGKRADSIIRSMMQHSRGGKGVRELTKINPFVEEYLQLTYHGKRAQDAGFNVKLTSEYDPEVGELNIVPQEMGRVLLNLISNACDAAAEHARQSVADFMPEVAVSTEKTADHIKIRVSDNGSGIPADIQAKIFEPFFTTKPTGKGTGLGLSLSYDIVTEGHGGALEIETTGDSGTTFLVSLPYKKETS